MNHQKLSRAIFSVAVVSLVLVFAAIEAFAVPSFKRQTGQDCMTCHTIFPELTSVGRAFKLTGYVLNKKMTSYQFPPPLSGMAQMSFTHTKSAQPSDSVADVWSSHFLSSGNDNIAAPQQASLFYAGQIYDKLGAFVQGTYASDTNKVAMDFADIRYANSFSLCDKDFIYGITLNNNPTGEDLWNTTPAFSFPYAASNVAPAPAASTLIDNTLATQVGGVGLYAYYNSWVYAAFTVYRTTDTGITYPFGAGNTISTIVDGAAPYWRVALQHQWNDHSFELGTYGMAANVFSEPYTNSPTNHFTDVALDAQYQFIHANHVFSAQTTWIHENQNLAGSFALGNAENQYNSLNTYKINLNYYYRSKLGTIGGSGGFFSTTGSTDTGLYASDPVGGSYTGSPNSNGFILEMDYLAPWQYAYTKFSVQYVIYNKFNGSGTNYDGFGRNASGNNTLYLLVWLAF